MPLFHNILCERLHVMQKPAVNDAGMCVQLERLLVNTTEFLVNSPLVEFDLCIAGTIITYRFHKCFDRYKLLHIV